MLVVPNNTSIYNNSQQSDAAIQQQYYYTTDTSDLDLDIDLDLDLDSEHSSQSISSSPQSIQSFLSHYSAAEASPLATFAGVPAAAVPRGVLHDSLLKPSTLGQPSMMTANDMMASESWLSGNTQFANRSGGGSRASHHRESSLSSLGSAGPASPYSQNTSNPHIAVTDSMGDAYQNLPYYDDSSYQLAKSLNQPNHDAFYTNHGAFTADPATAANYASFLATHKNRADRGLLPPPELSVGSNRSRPMSVASSVASDSPATPLPEQPEDDRRRKTVFSTVPKLDRTMTDIYSDELYSPSFAITSASPSQSSQVSVSPSHDMFAQRLQAINSQHLSVAHSPVPTSSRDKSPFRQGSPLAPSPMHDFASSRYNSAQQVREQRKAEQDAQALRQQLSRSSDAGTPQTISPKDAILDFSEADGEANFPLFPQPNGSAFDGAPITKTEDHPTQVYDAMPSLEEANFNYLPAQLPNGLQVPQQYPFVAQARQASSNIPMGGVPLNVSTPVSSTESSSGASLRDSKLSRPSGTNADGGTYTCTYHGCTLRFETPALLQKHKREGHRQAHGLNTTRRTETGITSSLVNSQAGPHRCDRINPSTGKSCSTIFSRPYDLTRHEDTIHNGRKQKVRCGMCTEEKTFSRADALTRHYRVCHPDVEFPGKHRRRGGHGN